MQDFKKYSKELSASAHKHKFKAHIMNESDFKDFAGFHSYEIWGDEDCDFERYEKWLKEQ